MTGSSFAQSFSANQSVLDANFGETVRWIPQIRSSAARIIKAGPDTGRPVREIVGILDDESYIDKSGTPLAKHDNEYVETHRVQIDFQASLFINRDWPQQGDVIVAITQPGSPRYRVIIAEPDGLSRVVVKLERMSP